MLGCIRLFINEASKPGTRRCDVIGAPDCKSNRIFQLTNHSPKVKDIKSKRSSDLLLYCDSFNSLVNTLYFVSRNNVLPLRKMSCLNVRMAQHMSCLNVRMAQHMSFVKKCVLITA